MFDKVAQLQRPPFHPKWKELAPRATVAGLADLLQGVAGLARPQYARGRGGVGGIGRGAGPGAPAGSRGSAPLQQRDSLYREFLEWRASRAKATTSR